MSTQPTRDNPYYGLWAADDGQLAYEGPLDDIDFEGDYLARMVTSILDRAPDTHLLLVPENGILILIRSDGNFKAQIFTSQVPYETTLSLIAELISRDVKLEQSQVADYMTLEING